MNKTAFYLKSYRSSILRGFVFLAWSVVPLPFLFTLLLKLQWFLGHRSVWKPLSLVWMVSSILVLLYCLAMSGGNEPALRSHNVLLNLVGAFAIGLPSIGLAILGFATSFDHFPENLNPKGSQFDLWNKSFCDGARAGVQPGGADSKVPAYFFLIDVSKSFLPTNDVEDRKSTIKDVVEKVFSGSGSIDPLLKPGDGYCFSYFAGTRKAGLESLDTGNIDHANLQQLTGRFWGELSREALNSELQTNNTSLIDVLSGLQGDLKRVHEKYSYVRVVIFSDLVHDSETKLNAADIKKKLRSLEDNFLGLNNVGFVSFVADSKQDERPDPAGRVRVHFENLERIGRWREIRLADYKNYSSEERMSTLLLNVFPVIDAPDTLYLKYLAGPDWRPVPSFLDVSGAKQNELLIFGLQPSSRGGGILPAVPMRLDSSSGDSFEISSGNDKNSAKTWQGYLNPIDTLTAQLARRPDVSRSSEYEFILTSPSHSATCRVKTVVLQALGEDPSWFFRLLVAFLCSIPAILSGYLFVIIWRNGAKKVQSGINS